MKLLLIIGFMFLTGCVTNSKFTKYQNVQNNNMGVVQKKFAEVDKVFSNVQDAFNGLNEKLKTQEELLSTQEERIVDNNNEIGRHQHEFEISEHIHSFTVDNHVHEEDVLMPIVEGGTSLGLDTGSEAVTRIDPISEAAKLELILEPKTIVVDLAAISKVEVEEQEATDDKDKS